MSLEKLVVAWIVEGTMQGEEVDEVDRVSAVDGLVGTGTWVSWFEGWVEAVRGRRF
jgi:hypothetical protein